jgi:hypothetical protein
MLSPSGIWPKLGKTLMFPNFLIYGGGHGQPSLKKQMF